MFNSNEESKLISTQITFEKEGGPVVNPWETLDREESPKHYYDVKSHENYVIYNISKCLSISPVFLTLSITILITLFLFGFTCWSLSNHPLVNGSISKCSDWNPYTPYYIKIEQTNNNFSYKCGWRSRNQALRFIMCLLSIFSPIIVLMILNKKLSEYFYWIYMIICFIFAGFFFWAAIIDGEEIAGSRKYWDSEDMQKYYKNTSAKITLWPFIFTVFMDVLTCIAWVACGTTIARFKWHKKQET